jgi:hypothetical protein
LQSRLDLKQTEANFTQIRVKEGFNITKSKKEQAKIDEVC